MINLSKGHKGILTTANWVYATDGHSYLSFFGFCRAFKAEDVMGCRTGSGQADYIIQVGTANPLIIAGCQFHSFHLCDKPPGGRSCFEVI